LHSVRYSLLLSSLFSVQVLQQNLDSVHDDLEHEKKKAREAQKDVDSLVTQLADTKTQLADAQETQERLTKQLEALREESKV
jgi:septal ring factor EnvC (AmiA/AmiB activator)